MSQTIHFKHLINVVNKSVSQNVNIVTFFNEFCLMHVKYFSNTSLTKSIGRTGFM